MKLFLGFLLLSSIAFGQSKKKQIESLNKSLDSINYVIEAERKLHKDQIEILTNRVDSLNTFLQTTRENASKHIASLNTTTNSLNSEIAKLKNDVSGLETSITKHINNNEKLKLDLEEMLKKNRLLEEISSISPFYIYWINSFSLEEEVPDQIFGLSKPPVNASGMCLELEYCPYYDPYEAVVAFNLGRYKNGKKQGEWISNSPIYTWDIDETDYYTPLNEAPINDYTSYAVMTYKDGSLVKTSYINEEFKEFAYSIIDNLGEETFYHSNSILLFESSRAKVFYNNGNIAREKNLDNGNYIFYNRDGSVYVEEPGDIFEIGKWEGEWPCQ